MSKIYNFSAGPAVLPRVVLEEAQRDLLDYDGSGISVLESSHRSKEFVAIQDEAEANVRSLLNISDDFAVLFLQGGASTQFAMAPMNLLPEGRTAAYTSSGSWASKAIKEAQRIGTVGFADFIRCDGVLEALAHLAEQTLDRFAAVEVRAVLLNNLICFDPYPAGVNDCYAALVWFADHAAEFGVDPERIAIAGQSAGGGLAAATALMARDLGGPALS